MSHEGGLLKAQQLLEVNEDLMEGIIENMQIGRLDDSMKLFSLLYGNLMSMATELDSYPFNDSDPYTNVTKFPDAIMRRKVIDILCPSLSAVTAASLKKPSAGRGHSDIVPVPSEKSPAQRRKITKLPSVCERCHNNGQTSRRKCRIDLAHVDPPATFTTLEKDEFARAAQMIQNRYREMEQEQARSVRQATTPKPVVLSSAGLEPVGPQGGGSQLLLSTSRASVDGVYSMSFPHANTSTAAASVASAASSTGTASTVSIGTGTGATAAAAVDTTPSTTIPVDTDPNSSTKGKRLYRRWTTDERHTVCVGIFLNGGSSFAAIAAMLSDRSRGQVRRDACGICF